MTKGRPWTRKADRPHLPWGWVAPLWIATVSVLAPDLALAAREGPVPQAPIVPPGYLAETAWGLALVLLLFFAALFLVRRISPLPMRRDRRLAVVDVLALGTRERIILLNADGRHLLLSTTPGQVRLLYDLGQLSPAPPPVGTEAPAQVEGVPPGPPAAHADAPTGAHEARP